MSKYSTPEDKSYRARSSNTILSNKLGIVSAQEMENEESRLLQQASEEMIDIYGDNHQFTAKDLRNLHKLWLGDIYTWAGDYRTVNMSKGGFTFAAARLIPNLMGDFEEKYLKKHTPTHAKNKEQLTLALAIVHVEFILIHPFREGNGRLGRMLSILMFLQAGFSDFDFDFDIIKYDREYYFRAIQQGMDRNYDPMIEIFNQVIRS